MATPQTNGSGVEVSAKVPLSEQTQTTTTAATADQDPSAEPEGEYDVIIIGAGPAGLMASTCLTTYGFSVCHIDDRSEPTTAGRADGLQPRTLEVLRNIGSVQGKVPGKAGLAKRMIAEGVRVYEVAFWDPTETEKLARTSRAPSCPNFIDVVDNYTLLLHQGLIENAYLDEIEARRAKLPAEKLRPMAHGGVYRPYNFITCATDLEANPEYPVSATLEHGETKKKHTVKGKYLMGCDGARSLVRRAISGGEVGDGEWQGKIRMLGEASDIVWGVMDVVVKTDFPDIMSKCLIHSRASGSIMVIPRENGLVRLYVQLQSSEEGTQTHFERSAATQDICIERAKKIFEPYQLEVGHTDWFSVYQIGQRIASNYTLDHRIFLGGDATHTHSPKAGQGMNISMLDMYSLAWKINLVEKGMADPKIILPTYEEERRGIAEELLAFDKSYSAIFSGRSPKSDQLTSDVKKAKSNGAVDAELFIETFRKNCYFTSGCGAFYMANVLNAVPDSEFVKAYPKAGVFNPAGSKLICGQRLPPGKLTRATDANQCRIQQEVKMTGAFRINIFAGDFKTSQPLLKALDTFLRSPTSFLNVHRPTKSTPFASTLDGNGFASRYIESDAKAIELQKTHNPFFTFLTVFSTPHTEWDIEKLPPSIRIYRDQIYSDDIEDLRVKEVGSHAPIHTKYGVDTSKGSIIVVRPDGYVGAVVTLSEDGFEGLNAYFKGFLTGVGSK